MNSNNHRSQTFIKRRTKVWFIFIGFVIALIFLKSGKALLSYTSSDKYCISCHIHPMADQSWKLSTHYNNNSGNIIHCVDCHLPPEGHGYLFAKAKHGFKDAWGYFFKDSAKINCQGKKLLENAKGFVYEKSCLECHQNLFPIRLSLTGGNAHLFYTTSKEPLNCINCHLNVGHYNKNALHAHDTNFGVTVTVNQAVFTEPAKVEKFENFNEKLPGTNVSFDMIAIPGGTFNMGSPENEPFQKSDEGPLRKVTLSKFWIAKTEVTWDEYLAFFRATGSQGRTEGQVVIKKNVDAISGATPPWGAPDQGCGKGSRPAITMSWHAAYVYCQWLSRVTGKKYRLPTEAEWEYTCRGGSKTPYFFDGNPKDYTSSGLLALPDVDVVILATPPQFRPAHFLEAVSNNKHAFLEKPVAVDPVGIRSVITSAKKAAAIGLCVVTGTQRHHQEDYIETYKQVVGGAIGTITSAKAFWNQDHVWFREREKGWNDMEYMIRNWNNFCWLCGDHILDTHVHNIDVINWFLGKHPEKAIGYGCRHRRVTGDQYDFFSIDFDYGNGVSSHSMRRQIDSCANGTGEVVMGTEGFTNCVNTIWDLKGKVKWQFEYPKDENGNPMNAVKIPPYVQEHMHLGPAKIEMGPVDMVFETPIPGTPVTV